MAVEDCFEISIRDEEITAMAQGYEQTRGSLADRLMAALLAGDCAGGDHHGCLAAGIRVVKRDVADDWLALYVDGTIR